MDFVLRGYCPGILAQRDFLLGGFSPKGIMSGDILALGDIGRAQGNSRI